MFCVISVPPISLQIAIKDSANPLPTVMYQGFERFDIKIVLEVTPNPQSLIFSARHSFPLLSPGHHSLPDRGAN